MQIYIYICIYNIPTSIHYRQTQTLLYVAPEGLMLTDLQKKLLTTAHDSPIISYKGNCDKGQATVASVSATVLTYVDPHSAQNSWK